MLRRTEGMSWTKLLQGILKRALPFFFVGLLLGLFYPLINERGQQAILGVISEHAPAMTFDLLASYSVAAISLFASFGGRTTLPIPKARLFLGYYPAKAALDSASIFSGIILGFACGRLPHPISLRPSAFMAMFYSCGILILMIAASFKGRVIRDERISRVVSILLALSVVGLFVKHYIL